MARFTRDGSADRATAFYKTAMGDSDEGSPSRAEIAEKISVRTLSSFGQHRVFGMAPGDIVSVVDLDTRLERVGALIEAYIFCVNGIPSNVCAALVSSGASAYEIIACHKPRIIMKRPAGALSPRSVPPKPQGPGVRFLKEGQVPSKP